MHARPAEDAHQVVLKREVEARAAGVALASGAAAQLIVDAAGFVAFRAHDVQAAERDYFFVFLVDLCPDRLVDRVPFGFSNRVGILVLLAQPLPCEEVGIAAKQNVGTAAGHVRGHGYGALAAGLGHDKRLAFVILGVQNLVLDAHFLQESAQSFALFD